MGPSLEAPLLSHASKATFKLVTQVNCHVEYVTVACEHRRISGFCVTPPKNNVCENSAA